MNGVIVIDKPSDYTSRDIVNIVSKKINSKKVGHTGTLDPLATGVLVICINEGTKLVEYLTEHDKDYIATVKLGIMTDTLDITGNIIEEKVKNITKDEVLKVLNSFNKTYLQEVPIYSAVKVNGKKLYEYARNNEEVELPKHEVTVSNIKLLEYNADSFTFKVTVSKGTYIRSLIKDICCELGTIGVMSALRRTRVGSFNIEDANIIDEDNYQVINIDSILKDLPHCELDNDSLFQIKNGIKREENIISDYICYTVNNKVLAIYKRSENSIFRMYKIFKENLDF